MDDEFWEAVEQCEMPGIPFKKYNNVNELFTDQEFKDYLQEFWPTFALNINSFHFQNGKLTQEVGKLRELGIIFLLDRYLGEISDYKPIDIENIAANEKGKDWNMFSRGVSCKTITCSGGKVNNLKLSWMEDKDLCQKFEDEYMPEFDLMLCKIKWDSSDEGFYYISKEIQQEALDKLGRAECIRTSPKYGKGVVLARVAVDYVTNHPNTLKIPIKMPVENRCVDLRNQLFDNWYKEKLEYV